MVIFGLGNYGKIAFETARKYDIRITAVADNYMKGSFNGINISDIRDINRDEQIVISVQSQYVAHELYLQLSGLGFGEIYWFVNLGKNLKSRENFYIDECVDASHWGETPIPELQMHVSDKCNLNCRGCTHFSPLFNEVGCECDSIIYDIKQIKKLFTGIMRIDLLGGEPLLNPDLIEIIKCVRDELPYSFIYLFTNGLWLLKCDDEILRTIKDNRIKLSISAYEPTEKIIESIKTRLNMAEICYSVNPFESKTKFNLPLSINKKSKYPLKCISDGCITVANGKIARCPTLMYIDKFNETFNQKLPNEGIYGLDELKDMNASSICEILKQRVPLCDYCVENPIEWSGCSNPIRMSDFAALE